MMISFSPLFLALVLVQGTPASQAPAKQPPSSKPAASAPRNEARKAPDPEAELQRAIELSGNDRAALLHNLEEYLRRFPEAPRKQAVYRALVEASMQLNDTPRALDYAERIIALRPDDSAMMLFAVDLLERAGDDRSLTKAVGYISRVLDQLEKTPDEEKPQRVSPEDWDLERKKLRMSVYLIRGRLEMQHKNYDAASADLETSYHALPNAPAALRLGAIAEIRKQHEKAIEYYLNAFVMLEGYGGPGDRRDARLKLGNLWRLMHGSDAGLGEQILAAYDRMASDEAKAKAPERNAGVTDPFAMELRRLSGPPLKTAELKGKVVVLSFWATWCRPCRELEPLIEEAIKKYEANQDVVFLAPNRDEDESLVTPFVQQEKLRATVVFSDGLERVLQIEAIPTVIVIDRAGKIVFRAQGFLAEGFLDGLSAAIARATAPAGLGIN